MGTTFRRRRIIRPWRAFTLSDANNALRLLGISVTTQHNWSPKNPAPLKVWLHKCVFNGYTNVMTTKDVGLRIRVDRSLRTAFLEVCRAEDRPAAQVIRQFMRNYVEDRKVAAQQELFPIYPIRKRKAS